MDSEEIIKNVKRRLAAFRTSRRFIVGREVYGVASDLVDILDDIKTAITDPREGIKLVAGIYKSDKHIFNHCDDSSGSVGDVFRIDARETFVHFARKCEDKDWLCDIIIKLNEDNGYGVRDCLFDYALTYLNEDMTRKLVGHLWKMTGSDNDRQWYCAIETIARQLKDPSMFEKARLASWPAGSTAAYIDIARAYLEADDPKSAELWLEKVSVKEDYMADERRKLALAIYKKIDNQQKVNEIAWAIFRNYRDMENFSQLLGVVGHNKKSEIIKEETAKILSEKEFNFQNAIFLLENDQFESAEKYVIDRAILINGVFYGSVLPLAEMFEKKGLFLGASLLYRTLLDSILHRAQSKYYRYGIRYLKKLVLLAPKIIDWGSTASHSDYYSRIKADHGRKTSFWAKISKFPNSP